MMRECRERAKPLFLKLAITLAFSWVAGSDARAGLVINLINNGGVAPTNAVGGGNLASIFAAAASVWQAAILDNYSLNIGFSWGTQSAGVLAAHSLVSQGGSPNRETAGNIVFDNDLSSLFYLDPTPLDNSEYTTFTESTQNLGGGTLNTGRVYTGATGLAAGRTDLFSVALHEIGHALGLSAANTAFQAEVGTDGDVDVTGPRPFAGSMIPIVSTTSAHVNIGTALMFPSIGSGIRRYASAADILANAQISRFTDLNLNPTAVPEPSSLAMGGMALLLGLGAWGYRGRKAA